MDTLTALKKFDNLETLPFNTTGQRAVIGHILTDEAFYHRAIVHVKHTWFLEPQVGTLWKVIERLAARYGRQPTQEEVRNAIIRKATPVEANKLDAVLIACMGAVRQMRLENVRAEATQWLKTRIYHAMLKKSSDAFNAEKFQEAYGIMESSLKELSQATFESPSGLDVGDIQTLLHKQSTEYNNALTFGVNTVDKCLLELEDYSNVKGALLPGDTTIILAPVNIGKSTTIITCVAANLKQEKYVLWTTHEGRDHDLMTKMWCCLTDCSKQGLRDLITKDTIVGPDGVARATKPILDRTLEILRKYLVYIPFNKAGGTIEEVVSVVRDQNENLKNRIGHGFDMWACDYAANLTTVQAQKGMSRRERDDIVYSYVVDLAGELKFHALTAIQSNREGSKLNRWHQENKSRLLSMEDASESFGPMMRATNVISGNRDDTAAGRNRITFFICKSRSSKTGWAIVCRSNFDHSKSHGDDLGSIYFQSHQSMSEKVDHFLDQYSKKADPFVSGTDLITLTPAERAEEAAS